jgi:hypothetical protein
MRAYEAGSCAYAAVLKVRIAIVALFLPTLIQLTFQRHECVRWDRSDALPRSSRRN